MSESQSDQAQPRVRYRIIFAYAGAVFSIAGFLFLLPLLGLLFEATNLTTILGFIFPATILIVAGWFLRRLMPKGEDEPEVSISEGMAVVVLIWLTMIIIGTIPFIMGTSLNPLQALFEATSGWTTCGLSLLDVSDTPKIILLYRSSMQLVGGIGFIILTLSSVAAAAPADKNLLHVIGLDSTFVIDDVRHGATLIIGLYGGYAVFGIITYLLLGMSLFDAINHAFTAIATGGFSTNIESIGFWDDPLIESVTIVLMLAGALNFSTAYLLLRGKFRIFLQNSEVRLTFLLLVLVVPIVFFGVTAAVYTPIAKGLRVAVFESVSALTGTGFTTASNYDNWVPSGWLVLIILMLIGGGSGSTTGGIKQNRVYILYKSIVFEMRNLLSASENLDKPRVWRGEEVGELTAEEVQSVSVFVALYFVFLTIGTLIFTLHGYSLKVSLFEFASTLGTVGLTTGITNVDAPATQLLTQITAMILGRLEFFAVIIGLLKLFSVQAIRQPFK